VAAGIRVEGDNLILSFADPSDCRMLKNRENVTLLTEFALDFFQSGFRIRFVLPGADTCDLDPEAVAPHRERQLLANDSLVLTAVDIFNGEVGDIRVGPRFRLPLQTNDEEAGGQLQDEE
jgi:DNA polymerase-3 subunit gamma/tau